MHLTLISCICYIHQVLKRIGNLWYIAGISTREPEMMISQVLMAYNNYADVENILINAKVSGRVFVANRRKPCPA